MQLVELELPTRRATRRLARAVAAELAVGDLLILSGPLGAGKTFIARALCRALGVPEEIRVTSPSFALIHELEGRMPIAHADLYRAGSADEVVELGLREMRARAVVMVEWGEPYRDLLGGCALLLDLEPHDAGRRARLSASEDFEASRALRLAAEIRLLDQS